MSRIHQDTLFPQILYFAGKDEDAVAIETAASEAGAMVDVWHFDPTPERPPYMYPDNSDAARAARVAGAARWEGAGIIAISNLLPAERVRSIAEGASNLHKTAALIVSQEAEVDWVAHGRFPPLQATTPAALGCLVRTLIDNRANS